MQSQEIRRKFLQFFKQKGHTLVPSSSVVPHDDPTLLFVNAGMNQFKDVFLGSKREYVRASTSQKCIRVGGKHNDLDNVGHTTRHLTLFEMLGNFSFGDYFKKEAIAFAWEVATEVFAFPAERIWVTVFQEDDEAFALWEPFIPKNRIVRMGEKDNFWAMGDTGPCGPCSELLFDRGDRYSSASNPKDDPTGERFLEFWNLVFMQFNRDIEGRFHPLPKPSIDTGSGLERVVSLKMGVDTVFATDILRSLIAQVENVSLVPYDPNDLRTAPAFHVIADHIRSLAFAIADGAQPGNVERGYVLRKILRRAVRYGKTLGMQQPFLAKVLPRLIETMGEDYPELGIAKTRIEEILTLEEEAFFRTLKRGGSLLNQVIEKASLSPLKQIEGEEAFKLKDTYGLPLEEILLLAKDARLEVNLEAYQILEELAREKSRAAESKVLQEVSTPVFKEFVETHGPVSFVGYEKKECEATVLGILREGSFVSALEEGQEGAILLSHSPFYAEMGGQIGDEGILEHHKAFFAVSSCETPYPGIFLHKGQLKSGVLLLGEPVIAKINEEKRQKTANNHTATHLLHAALQTILGPHIRQAGSLVEPTRLRFDFNHHKAVTSEELRKIEEWVNEKIRENKLVQAYELSYDEAQKRPDIKQFFGEKYGSSVRVIDIEDSKELCGGTHTHQTGTIGFFRITKESSIAAGVRRIEAVTGKEAEELFYRQDELLAAASSLLKTQPSLLVEKVQDLLQEQKNLSLAVKQAQKQLLGTKAVELLSAAPVLKGVSFVCGIFALEMEELKLLADELVSRKDPLLCLLALQKEGSCHLFVRVSPGLQRSGLQAGALIKEFAPLIQGSGGGKADAAQAGGKDAAGLKQVFSVAKQKLEALC